MSSATSLRVRRRGGEVDRRERGIVCRHTACSERGAAGWLNIIICSAQNYRLQYCEIEYIYHAAPSEEARRTRFVRGGGNGAGEHVFVSLNRRLRTSRRFQMRTRRAAFTLVELLVV